MVSGAEFSFCTLRSLRTVALMMYSCSVVTLRRGAGATAGGAFACACTCSAKVHKPTNPITAAATARKLDVRTGQFISGALNCSGAVEMYREATRCHFDPIII